MKITLPLKPDDEAILHLWNDVHGGPFTALMFRFGRLHYAIHGQENAGGSWHALKQVFDEWEEEMLEDYMSLTVAGILDKVHDGYANAATYAAYHQAVATIPQHEANYRQLRRLFNSYLEEG